MVITQYTINERVRVSAFPRDRLHPGFVALKLGQWDEVEVAINLSPEDARALSCALEGAADTAEQNAIHLAKVA